MSRAARRAATRGYMSRAARRAAVRDYWNSPNAVVLSKACELLAAITGTAALLTIGSLNF